MSILSLIFITSNRFPKELRYFSLGWNPPIHCLISEGVPGDKTPWRKVPHFNFTFLCHAFCTALLNELHKNIGSSFKKTKSIIYKQCKEGFYVYAKPKKCEPNAVASYIGRYLGRPVIATSRIDDYDGDFVTFHYNRHEDDKLITEKISALDLFKFFFYQTFTFNKQRSYLLNKKSSFAALVACFKSMTFLQNKK